ncbi:MAG: hypothetical protein ABH867_00445 [Patescibacteria group bacterium]
MTDQTSRRFRWSHGDILPQKKVFVRKKVFLTNQVDDNNSDKEKNKRA